MSKNTIRYEHIYFSPKELWAITSALAAMLQDLKASENEDWNGDAKKMREEIKINLIKAAQKIERVTGVKSELPDYNEGDERDFLN
ncbi:hypothetical protein GCM10027051_16090 [Niabella terrae]